MVFDRGNVGGYLVFNLGFLLGPGQAGKIRQSCAQKARQISEGTKSGLSNMLEINRAVYLDCLKSNGIDR
jgi:hypothetical protein